MWKSWEKQKRQFSSRKHFLCEIESLGSKERNNDHQETKEGWVGCGGFFSGIVLCLQHLQITHSGLVGLRERQAGDVHCVYSVHTQCALSSFCMWLLFAYLFLCVCSTESVSLYTLLFSLSVEVRWHIPGPSASLFSSAVCQWIHWQWSCVTSMSWGLSGG